jgi:hypothetical protein
MLSMPKPIIYISSTIYDFRDLRSALKYWLEELGYQVFLSEFNDFRKPIDDSSYNACLRSVESASYFILLIGARVGGFYDSSKNVSITRMEYRKAYDLLLSGRLKLITFVRESVWTVREDRKSLHNLLLQEYIKNKELNEDDVSLIKNHSSSLINDANSIFDFLNEAGRVNEMKEAVTGKGNFPPGNWIHTFNTFHDVIQTLEKEFGTELNLGVVALITNLKREILSNLASLTDKTHDGNIHLHTWLADFSRKSLTGDMDDSTVMPSRYVTWLVMYLIHFLTKSPGIGLSCQFIDHALTSGHFLEHDLETNTYRIGLLHGALFEVKENIDRLNAMLNTCGLEYLKSFMDKYSPKRNPQLRVDDSEFSIPNSELMFPLACYDCELNIAELCVAIYKAIDGDFTKISNLRIRAANPIEKEAAQLAKENPTIEEISAWIDTL